MPRMSKSQESGSRAVVAAALILLLLLPVLYFLSFGPAIYLVNHGYLNEQPAETFYRPIVVFYEACPPAQKPLEWYVSLFE